MSGLFLILTADCQPVLVFLFCCHPATDMTLRFVNIKNHTCLGCKGWIDMFQAICHVLMYCTFADPEFLRRLPYRRIVVYDVIGNGHRPLFDIIFQGLPLGMFLTSYAGSVRISPISLRKKRFQPALAT